jgi:hypothetical protein
MIDPAFARMQYVIPTLNKIGLYSLDAEKLLMGTAAVESNFKNFIQFGGGPARGMFQMEPATFNDLIRRVLGLQKREKLRTAVYSLANDETPTFVELTQNHTLAAAMARVKYFSIPAGIPSDLNAQADYWWTYYNGRSPHGLKPEDYLARWNEYCAELY